MSEDAVVLATTSPESFVRLDGLPDRLTKNWHVNMNVAAGSTDDLLETAIAKMLPVEDVGEKLSSGLTHVLVLQNATAAPEWLLVYIPEHDEPTIESVFHFEDPEAENPMELDVDVEVVATTESFDALMDLLGDEYDE